MLRYLCRRLLYAVPTIIVISIVSFLIIELPPGDFLSSYVATLEAMGDKVSLQELEALRRRYGLGQPIYLRYLKWVWGILHGDFGYSMGWSMPVKQLIWSRLMFTVVLSGSTLLFTWLLAIPIGILSATRQYSIADYVVTFFGFVGLGVPNFLLALLFMWVALDAFGMSVGGLFSPEFVQAPWSWARFVDMLKHLWIPLIILGTGGTAGLIRTMRANLLDELNKPYVVTARAKGLKERKLLWKYPVRLALNPFVSTVGYALPHLVSGSAIVSIVLSLPTSGPLLLRALTQQDMYLAGSFLLMLSLLTVIGTLISDVILAWLDPRIRYE